MNSHGSDVTDPSSNTDNLIDPTVYSNLFLGQSSSFTLAWMQVDDGADNIFLEGITTDSARGYVRNSLSQKNAAGMAAALNAGSAGCRLFSNNAGTPYFGGTTGACIASDPHFLGWFNSFPWCWWGYDFHSATGTGQCTSVSGSYNRKGWVWVR